MPRSVFERVLVTGGTGFIGRYVLDRLALLGIRPLVTARTQIGESAKDFEIAQLDLTDPGSTTQLIRSYRPNAVIHLAGVTGSVDPGGKRCFDVNVRATRGMLEALDAVGCDRVIMIGSAAEYGTQTTPFNEEMAPKPVSPYGISKAEATSLAMDMHAGKSFPVTVLRVFTAYGKGQPERMFLPTAIRHALSGDRFEMTGGTQRRDFVSVEDVAEAVVLAITNDNASGRIINIGEGRNHAIGEVAKLIWKRCGADSKLLVTGERQTSGDDALDTLADIGLAEKLLGWRPTVRFIDPSSDEDGLGKMIERMRMDI